MGNGAEHQTQKQELTRPAAVAAGGRILGRSGEGRSRSIERMFSPDRCCNAEMDYCAVEATLYAPQSPCPTPLTVPHVSIPPPDPTSSRTLAVAVDVDLICIWEDVTSSVKCHVECQLTSVTSRDNCQLPRRVSCVNCRVECQLDMTVDS